jgi:hypothetical protein
MKDRLFKYLLLFIALVYAINTSAQENMEQIQDNAEKKWPELNPQINKSLYLPDFIFQPETSLFGKTGQPLTINYNVLPTYQIHWDDTDRNAMDREALQSYFKPMFYSNRKHKDNFFPGVTAENINFYAASYDANLGFEGITTLGLGMQWKASEQLMFTANPFVARYFLMPFEVYSEERLSAGMKTMMTYQATDWLTMRLHGQYATNGVKTANVLLAPQTSFGGDFLVKFSKNFGLGGGVQFVNHAGKWIPLYYPQIHINAAKKKNR